MVHGPRTRLDSYFSYRILYMRYLTEKFFRLSIEQTALPTSIAPQVRQFVR